MSSISPLKTWPLILAEATDETPYLLTVSSDSLLVKRSKLFQGIIAHTPEVGDVSSLILGPVSPTGNDHFTSLDEEKKANVPKICTIQMFRGSHKVWRQLASGEEISVDASNLREVEALADYLEADDLLEKCARVYLQALESKAADLPGKSESRLWLIKHYRILEKHSSFETVYKEAYKKVVKEEAGYIFSSINSDNCKFEMLKKISSLGRDPLKEIFVFAASNGQLEVVQWLHTNYNIDQDYLSDAAQGAASHGQLEVVKWLCTNYVIDPDHLVERS